MEVMTNISAPENSSEKLCAYNVFDTSKTNPQYKIIKKCIPFEKYKTHKLTIVDNNKNEREFTFLKSLVPATSIYFDGTQYLNSWSPVTRSPETDKILPFIDKMTKFHTILGRTLDNTIPEIMQLFNNSESVTLDNNTVNKDGLSLKEYADKIVNLFSNDFILSTSMFYSLKCYLSITNYSDYFNSYLTSVIDCDDINLLRELATHYSNIIINDYLYLDKTTLFNLLKFIITVRVERKNEIVGTKYNVEYKNNEITITEIKEDKSLEPEFPIETCATNNLANFGPGEATTYDFNKINKIVNDTYHYNPYLLIELVQRINIKYISLNLKPISLKLIGLDVDRAQFVTHNTITTYSNDSLYSMISNGNYWSELQSSAPVYKYSIDYKYPKLILSAGQKIKYINSVFELVHNTELCPHEDYLHDAGELIVRDLFGLFDDKELLSNQEIVPAMVDAIKCKDADKKSRLNAILRLYRHISPEHVSKYPIVLSLIKPEDILSKNGIMQISTHVNLINKDIKTWFDTNKQHLINSIRNTYDISANISDELIYTIFMLAQCPEFNSEDYLKDTIKSINSNHKKKADNSLMGSLQSLITKSTAYNVFAILGDLRSSLMRDLFINTHLYKALYELYLYDYNNTHNGISVSPELHILLTSGSFNIMSIKTLFTSVCKNLLDTAYKSTNNFKSKIFEIIKGVMKSCGINTKDKRTDMRIAVYADFLRCLAASYLNDDEKTDIGTTCSVVGWREEYPFYIPDITGVMKAIGLVPECPIGISVFFTEKYLQEH